MKILALLSILTLNSLAGVPVGMSPLGTSGTLIPAVAWYKLDGSAADSSGNGYNGTWSGTAAYSGGGASFAGASLISAAIPDQLGNLTMSFWMTKTGVTPMVPLGDATTGGSPGWGIPFVDNVASGRIRFLYSSFNSTNAETTAFSGRRAHISITRSGAASPRTVKIYENGNLLLTQNTTVAPTAKQSFAIGGFGLYTGNFRYVGVLDDVRIYSRALSAENIQRIMTGQDVAPIEELQ